MDLGQIACWALWPFFSLVRFSSGLAENKALIKAWNDSEKIYNFLGLWHTHPEDIPTPSPTDLKDINTVLNGITNLNHPILYLIIGRVKTGIWISNKNTDINFLGHIELK